MGCESFLRLHLRHIGAHSHGMLKRLISKAAASEGRGGTDRTSRELFALALDLGERNLPFSLGADIPCMQHC